MKPAFRSGLRSIYRLGIKLSACCFLTPAILFFLLRNRRLFKNALVMPFYIGSFGNSFLALDFTARLHAMHRISLVMVRDPDQNPYLPAMFGDSMDLYWVDTKGFAPYTVGAVLRTLMYILCPLVSRAVIVEWEGVYRSLSSLSVRVVGSEEQDRLVPVPYDQSGYVYLLKQGIGDRPHLPSALIRKCKDIIAAKHPDFFSRPFITLLLRAKGQDNPELSTRARSSGPIANYRDAITQAIARGYHVVGTGETDCAALADLPGFFDLGEVPGAPGLMNMFLLSNCSLFWGQQSGPLAVANSLGIPCLITDAMPYRHGTYGAGGRDIILHKPLMLPGQKVPLDLVTIYTQHADLALGYGFARKGATIGFNSPQELRQALDEALDRLASPPPPDVAVMADQLRELMAPTMPSRYHSSRPPEFVLRSLSLK